MDITHMHGHFTMDSRVAYCGQTCSEHEYNSQAFLNAEPADKRNKKSSKLGNENVQNLQHSEAHNTGDGLVYLPDKDT